ncbi:MAG: phosphatidylglycerophosphatase A [Acidobacteria bacterium]|nr:phosphatidylglycerophosphatase A [Acidobacteriota bacterium]
MTNTPPEAQAASPPRAGLLLATGLGLGYAPVAPGTAGSLGAAALFAFLHLTLEGAAFHYVYLFVLAWLVPIAMWSTEQALAWLKTHDPQAIVIDEILGQWLTYSGLVLAAYAGLPAAGWKYLLAGFILFRAFDILKPFPIRRSERLGGATGVVVDDALAGAYAAAVLGALAWTGWLN